MADVTLGQGQLRQEGKRGECGKDQILLKSSHFTSRLLILMIICSECPQKGPAHGVTVKIARCSAFGGLFAVQWI